jgi:fumarate reductase subunit C
MYTMVVVLVLWCGVVVKVAQLDPSTLFGLPKRSGPIIFHWISARRAPIIIIINIISLIIISSPEL